jgi:hypothetical protein
MERDLNKVSNGKSIHEEYQKYVKYCEFKGKKPRTFTEWNYATYSAFEENWRLNH